MKNLSLIVLAVAGLTGLAVVPAMAAPSVTATGNAPFCNSTDTQTNLANGVYAQELSHGGQSLDNVEVWNGCLKATYTNSKGHTTVAFYDPDSLRLIDTLGGTQG